ncbi:MAG TPA: shikimate dehydrogenase [Pyrinomonadaceae bacterium]
MENHKAKICVPVCVRRVNELADSVKRAQEVADVVELRIDCVEAAEVDAALKELASLHETTSRPFILTFRPAEQGGARPIAAAHRVEFWLRKSQLGVLNSFPDFADVELELLETDEIRNQLSSKRLICSHHDFAGVPGDLEDIYRRMAATNASIFKIAVQADDATDCIPILKLLERAQREGRELIAIAMGQAGLITRILGPSRGSFLTYGSLDETSGTAPGQVTARELREVYRIDGIDRETQIMGVVGRPVAHSISPYIHNAAFAEGNLNAVFIPIEVHDVDAFMRRMARKSSREIEWNLRGLAVTAPHKSAVMKHLDWIEPAAKEIGAVNTIVLQDGELHGYNTDAAGFVGPLKSRIESFEGVRCAVIGAGGAARAVAWALRQEQASVSLFARDPDKAKAIKDQFDVECHPVAGATFNKFDLVINATPLGTRGELETETPATVEQLRGVRLAYDLVYNPLATQFMREARQAGCETVSGLEMLIGQALEQFRLWAGKEPDVETMRDAAKSALNIQSDNRA